MAESESLTTSNEHYIDIAEWVFQGRNANVLFETAFDPRTRNGRRILMESWMILNIANFVSLAIALFICISVIVFVQYNKKKSKILLLPLINFCLASLIQINFIIGYGRPYHSGEALSKIFRLYFINDSVMVFGYIYIPSIVIGTIIPLLVIVISALRQRKTIKG
ncbi:MAG TPA: hypothetical protein VIM70_08510 [Clostridium sp.]|uniref:hypothetical protein n=1 Tax=Clostridium sp. TaxID=1506 RepID=UPI002F94C77F